MRLGKVRIAHEYVVDLDNKDMVEHAHDALYDDITSMVKYNEVANWIRIEEGTVKSDEEIPEFLREVI